MLIYLNTSINIHAPNFITIVTMNCKHLYFSEPKNFYDKLAGTSFTSFIHLPHTYIFIQVCWLGGAQYFIICLLCQGSDITL